MARVIDTKPGQVIGAVPAGSLCAYSNKNQRVEFWKDGRMTHYLDPNTMRVMEVEAKDEAAKAG